MRTHQRKASRGGGSRGGRRCHPRRSGCFGPWPGGAHAGWGRTPCSRREHWRSTHANAAAEFKVVDAPEARHSEAAVKAKGSSEGRPLPFGTDPPCKAQARVRHEATLMTFHDPTPSRARRGRARDRTSPGRCIADAPGNRQPTRNSVPTTSNSHPALTHTPTYSTASRKSNHLSRMQQEGSSPNARFTIEIMQREPRAAPGCWVACSLLVTLSGQSLSFYDL